MNRRNQLLWFAVPALALYAVFGIYPLISAVRLSLTSFTGVGDQTWVGLRNYIEIMRNPEYFGVLKVTLMYSAVVVIVQNALGLVIAALLFSLPKIRNASRVALLVPSMYSAVVAAYVWQFIYSPLGGGLNELLKALSLGDFQKVWLGDPGVALLSVAAVQIWMYVGYSTAIFLAGYMSIPAELHDAARIDGANAWQRFLKIDVPLLAPSFTVNITLSTIGTLKSFELPLVLTQGGPDGATTTLGLQIFNSLFSEYRFGFSSALSIVMLLMIAVIACLQNWFLRRREQSV
ncbi:sugar ABC transporter permease [Burkholderia sp. Nafp2/4-1b]|uniref:carbohydrate ABC transporter permease n=1 Tax=Burkholderia sp. Nafp2/4-1b TaxID=2116686 RepID=UPI000EF85A60|nr:sugar ABC transporter permease [Burkholderia sp. Nafp2/4-1b]RKU00066.1 sugar ABC transporter permease [Burkholderia sp. Nafp2/4-1b]